MCGILLTYGEGYLFFPLNIFALIWMLATWHSCPGKGTYTFNYKLLWHTHVYAHTHPFAERMFDNKPHSYCRYNSLWHTCWMDRSVMCEYANIDMRLVHTWMCSWMLFKYCIWNIYLLIHIVRTVLQNRHFVS